jgi:hypothetical protein
MIDLNTENIEHTQKALAGIKGGAEKALSRSLNKAVKGIRTDAVRSAREEYVAKAKDIRSTIRISRSKPNALRASAVSRGKRISLYNFKVSKQNVKQKRPVRVQVKNTGGAMKPLAHAFVRTMNGSQTGVFERVGKRRLPIKKLTGPAAPTMIGSETVRIAIEENALRRFEKELDHQIIYLMEGGR